MKAAGITDYETIGTFMGSELEHIQTKHPLYDRNSMVIVGDFFRKSKNPISDILLYNVPQSGERFV